MIHDLKHRLGQLKFQDWFFILFSLLWVGIIFLDYVNKQVVYGPSFKYFRYYGLFSFLSIVGVGFSMYINRLKFMSRFKRPYINGTMILAVVIGIVWAITIAFNQFWKAPLDYTNYLHLAGKAIFTLGCSFLLTLACYSSGSAIRSKLIKPEDPRSLTFVLLDIALGFVVYTMVMMALGVFGLLNQPLLLGVMTFMCLAGYNDAWWLIKKALWSPIEWAKDLNFWGGLLLFFMLVFLTMNYLYSQAPFPLGFDARNFYVNISKLISDAEALIPGFQPYAWGLVMSTGYIAFKSPEITLFISTLGGILTLFGIYDFSKRYLGVSSNLSIFAALLFLISPTVTNHWIIEFKIDLALLFIQMATLNIFMWWAFVKKKKETTPKLMSDRGDLNVAIVIGVLFGYALSVKVLSIFLVIALFIALWAYQKDVIGLLGMAALSIGAVILAGLDAQSGLREYHLSPNTTGGALAVVGLLLLGYSLIKSRSSFFGTIKPIIVMGLVMMLTFSPWVYKNYSFTKSTSFMKLLLGDKPSPSMTAPELIKNYRALQKAGDK